MLNDYLQIHTISLVFLGDFNPVIIQPFWLANKKLIREEEATNAKIELIHHELVRFNFDWATLEITKSRFEIRTSKEPFFEPIRDLATSIFGILKETPIRAVGINHILHYSIPTAEKYYDFGDKLAPLSNWNGFLKNPRMTQLEIIDRERADSKNGYYRIKVQTSDLIKDKGVAININDHFSIKKDELGRSGEMVKIVIDNWQNSINTAKEISEKIWAKVN